MKCLVETPTCDDDGCIVREVAVILAMTLAVVLISAHGPGHFYAYAQRWQAGATLGMLEPTTPERIPMGRWVLPHNQAGGVMRKGPVFSWICAAGLGITGIYDDWTYALPSILAAVGVALGTYVLGRRWYNRRTGLLAACLFIATTQNARLAFLATTDMLLTLWIVIAIACADRLTLHPCKDRRRVWHVIGLWAAMTLAAMTKGWGVVNIPVVAGAIGLAGLLGGGFRSMPFVRLVGDVCRTLLQRAWWLIKAVHAWWLIVVLLLVVLVVGLMRMEDPAAFDKMIDFELRQRATGAGDNAPAEASVPPALYLIYATLPMSIFSVGALLLTRPGRWLTQRGEIYLPLCWIIVTVVPFSFAHGFRPDYLLPCYPAVALLAAWAVGELNGRKDQPGRLGGVLRHVFAAVPVVIGAGTVVLAVIFLFHSRMPQSVVKALPMPVVVRPESLVLLWCAAAVGLGVVCWAIVASLKWRLRQVAAATCVGMLAVIFIYSHFGSRHARTGDGEIIRQFMAEARGYIDDDPFITYKTDGLCVQPYMGRLAPILAMPGTEPTLAIEMSWRELLEDRKVRWLITCDRGLVEMGQFEEAPDGDYRARDPQGVWRTFNTRAELLADGGGLLISERPVRSARWGRLYLIHLDPEASLLTRPLPLGYMSGK